MSYGNAIAPDRTKYHRQYYLSHKLDKKYTYVKQGFDKKLSRTQHEILQLVKQGTQLRQYVDRYMYMGPKNLYVFVNTASVDCLIASGHLKLENYLIYITDKGTSHRQRPDKKN